MQIMYNSAILMNLAEIFMKRGLIATENVQK